MVTVIHHDEIDRMARKNPQVQAREESDAKALVRLAQLLAPKLTGAGAASIHEEEQDDGTWRVSWDREHAYMKFQELGTENHRAQPFLHPAAKRLERG